MAYDPEEFKRLVTYADDLRADSSDRDRQLDRMLGMYMLEDEDAQKLEKLFENITVTLSPDPANAVDTAVRLMTTNEPDFSVPADMHERMEEGTADLIERLAGVMMRASDRVRGAPVCVDAARCGLLYDEIILSVNDTAEMEQASIGGSRAAKRRYQRAADRSPALIDAVDSHGCYYDMDHLGLRAFARRVEMTGQQIIETWGDDGERVVTLTDPATARKRDFFVWQMWDLVNYAAWVEGGAEPIVMKPHDLPYIPWVVRKVEGTRLFPDKHDQARPFLYTLDKSGLWRRQNLALTAIYTRVRTRLFTAYVHEADPSSDALDVDLTGPFNLVRVNKGDSLKGLPSDPAENEINGAWQLAQGLAEQSTLYRQVAGQALGPNATYSETALLQQAGRLPLTAVKRALEWALGDALVMCVLMLKEPGARRKRKDFEKLKPADIPDELEIEARLQLALPQDRLQQANIFRVLDGKVDDEYLYENILNVRQPGEMVKRLTKQRIRNALIDLQLQQMVQAAQPPPQAPPPQAPPDMGMMQGGLPPEMMAGGMQGPEAPMFEQGMAQMMEGMP